jgi:hypothetical protein
MELGALEEEEDDPADATQPSVAARSTPSAQARRDVAFVIIGVGGAALLGLGGIAGLYLTRTQPVAHAPVAAEDGYSADGDGTETE